MSDAIGSRGEAIFVVQLTKLHGRDQPRFRPQFLGDKFPDLDFFVELTGAGPSKAFFLAQVKSTRRGYTSKDRRLRAKIPKARMDSLAAYPVPTYLFGIDEIGETAFIVSANGEHPGGLSSIPTAHPIDLVNQDRLWDEVQSYWRRTRRTKLASAFIDPGGSQDDGV